ncbi:MAG: YkgJ family cysteine cluster protein [Planctomycetota bacterium]
MMNLSQRAVPIPSQEDQCRGCGKCCHRDVPVTLLDIHNIASRLGMNPKEAFSEYIEHVEYRPRMTFRIRKTENHACMFLTPERTCSIYEVRPGICELYLCRRDSKTRFRELLRDSGGQARLRQRMLEQAVASSSTRSYMAEHGTSWNQPSFKKALHEIQGHFVIRNAEKFSIEAQ